MSEDPDRVIKRLNKLLGVLKQSRDKGEERIAKLEADIDDYEKGILDTEGELKEYKEIAKREERYGLRLKEELSQAKSDISKLTAAIDELKSERSDIARVGCVRCRTPETAEALKARTRADEQGGYGVIVRINVKDAPPDHRQGGYCSMPPHRQRGYVGEPKRLPPPPTLWQGEVVEHGSSTQVRNGDRVYTSPDAGSLAVGWGEDAEYRLVRESALRADSDLWGKS